MYIIYVHVHITYVRDLTHHVIHVHAHLHRVSCMATHVQVCTVLAKMVMQFWLIHKNYIYMYMCMCDFA